MRRPLPRATTLTAALVAAGFVAIAAPRPAGAANPIAVRRNVPYATAEGRALLLDAYVPSAARTIRPAVVLVHGGGWRGGDKRDFSTEARRFATMGWVAFSVDYRLATPSAFPAEVDDVSAAIRWVRTHAGDYGVDPARVGALGASAGGHLVAMLATVGEGPLDAGARIRAAVSWSGPMDLTRLAGPGGVPHLTAPLFECTPDRCPEQWADASPVSHVDPTDAPLLLVNSTNELVPLDQAREMADRLQAAGVVHRLDVLPGGRHAQDFSVDEWKPTVAFLQRLLEPQAAPAAVSSRTEGINWVALGAGAAGAFVVAALIVARNRLRRRRPPEP